MTGSCAFSSAFYKESVVTLHDISSCAGVAMLSLLIGCSTGKGVPKTVSVSGTVKYKGKPLQGAEVSFQPKSTGEDSRPARGTTDSSGRFTLKTYIRPGTDVDGAVPGDYVVVVTKVESEKMSPEDMAKKMTSGKGMVAPKNQLPPRYADPKKSDLKASVSADGKNDFEFELKD